MNKWNKKYNLPDEVITTEEFEQKQMKGKIKAVE